MIELENVTKQYHSEGVTVDALRGITLHIDAGEYITIMGQSGSGKSTLLHILGAMDQVTGGSYRYNDITVSSLSVKEEDRFRKSHVSFVFQNYALMKYYTVFENVEVPLLAKGIRKKERKRIIEETLEEVGIAELRNKLPIHISGGQMQRCAIARALAANNDILLADEPTGALDRRTGEEIMDVFERIHRKDRIIILVSHDEKIAARTDRIIRIEDGVVIN